jgi:hypothetical protein
MEIYMGDVINMNEYKFIRELNRRFGGIEQAAKSPEQKEKEKKDELLRKELEDRKRSNDRVIASWGLRKGWKPSGTGSGGTNGSPTP